MCQVSIVHQRGAKGKHDKTHFGGGVGGGGEANLSFNVGECPMFQAGPMKWLL